ncbi:HNH endonuclease family protein [Actinomyces vulturis]|uniref:HNH endonuclease family protein n=1 Tax=Actinomyces vulturis TaxID=1857645 RepID=UPI0008314E25|nr:HNH endonuclease family protein [Actinomyces vulturis]
MTILRPMRPALGVVAMILSLASVVLSPALAFSATSPQATHLHIADIHNPDDGILSIDDALSALDSLPPDSPAPTSWHPGGREGWFGPSWEDVDHNGCDTRDDILARDLIDLDYSPDPGIQAQGQSPRGSTRRCPMATVWGGTLIDPYTGEVVEFTKGKDSSDAVQIDHVVPLNYVWAHGGWQWDAQTRLEIANDPLNLLAVKGQANQDKGASGPATGPIGSTPTGTWDPQGGPGWWPPHDEYRCDYALRFVSVVHAYDLGLPDADRAALKSTLRDCSSGGNGVASSGQAAWGALRIIGRVLYVIIRFVFRFPWLVLLVAVGVWILHHGRAKKKKHKREHVRRAPYAQFTPPMPTPASSRTTPRHMKHWRKDD